MELINENTSLKPYYKYVISLMYKKADFKRPGKGMYNLVFHVGPSYCNICGQRYNPNQISGCDKCFYNNFILSLTDQMIEEFINKNKLIIIDHINSKIMSDEKSKSVNLDVRNKLLELFE